MLNLNISILNGDTLRCVFTIIFYNKIKLNFNFYIHLLQSESEKVKSFNVSRIPSRVLLFRRHGGEPPSFIW